MTNEELKKMIKESLREVLKEEIAALYQIIIPSITSKEMSEIRKKYGSPYNYNEEDFVDMTDRVCNEDSVKLNYS